MFDRELVLSILAQIDDALERITSRDERIISPAGQKKAHPKTGFSFSGNQHIAGVSGFGSGNRICRNDRAFGLLIFGDIFLFYSQQHEDDRPVGQVCPFGERHFQHEHRDCHHHVNDIERVS